MKKAIAIHYFGSQKALADALNLHKSAISQWGDTIPELRAFQLERLTNGKLKHEPNVAAETTRSV
ncbi:Cro/CI family transcriptional regulator [Hahella sp. HN01]|uniref:Cro/CI family transcriptional regulator n=1 Tax=unclassified Hahella TaxID=2624107 RepID=UPI001C1EE46D|nr:Cro/CI family transcriptional regulator [Hahella sp. HN01]MBU6955993.1 Cro/Cl family transcriptional regulator [Hahella sp. HN01]